MRLHLLVGQCQASCVVRALVRVISPLSLAHSLEERWVRALILAPSNRGTWCERVLEDKGAVHFAASSLDDHCFSSLRPTLFPLPPRFRGLVASQKHPEVCARDAAMKRQR